MSIRIDKTIARVSGSANYMKDLAQVTGNMNTIDKAFYLKQVAQIRTTYENGILKVLNEIEAFDIVKKLNNAYKELDLTTVYIDKEHKKSKEKKISHVVRLYPRDIYRSSWFKLLREVESSATEVFNQFALEGKDLKEKQLEIISKNRESVDIFKFFGKAITEQNVPKAVVVCKKFTNKILEILLTPMYDCMGYIQKHWLSQIDQAVGAQVQQKTGKNDITQAEIQKYLYTFVLAKYRFDITGSSEQFTNVLFKSINEYEVADLDAGRFLDVIDNFKLDQIQGSEQLKKMAELAKDEMRKIISNENISPSEILKDVEKFLNTEPEPKKEETEQVTDDIF